MKKAILILMIFSSIIFSQDSISENDKIQHSVGVGYPGIFFRQHTDNGYIEYVGWLYASKKNKNISLNINKAKYLSKYNNDTLDFALKYIYGAEIEYKTFSRYYVRETDSSIGANIGIGIETINPQQNGIIIDLFVGETINYYFDDTDFSVSPMIRIAVLFNY